MKVNDVMLERDSVILTLGSRRAKGPRPLVPLTRRRQRTIHDGTARGRRGEDGEGERLIFFFFSVFSSSIASSLSRARLTSGDELTRTYSCTHVVGQTMV